MLWIIYAESANYCGYGEHWVVEAPTDEAAQIIASDDIDTFFREQDEDQLAEDGVDPDEVCMSHIVSVEMLDENHEHWGWYNDPTQDHCYHRVNF